MPPGPFPDFSPALPAGIDEGTVFRSLFAAYPDSLLLVDQLGQIVLANPAAAGLFGYSVDELVGLSVDALVPDSIRPCHASYREAYSHAPRARPMGTQRELVARRKDGSVVVVEIALSPLPSEGLPFVVAAIRDIGAYPRVKQALQRARYSEHLARLGRLAVDVRDPHVLLDHVPAIAAEALEVELATVLVLESNLLEFRIASGVGLLPDRGVGTHVSNTLDTPPGFTLAQAGPVTVGDFNTEHRFTVPSVYLEADMTSALAIPLSVSGRSLGVLMVGSRKPHRFGEDEIGFLESLANMLATSLQRTQAEDALNHAQRLESVGQLTGGIAHDFNNLLTVILGNLQVLEELPALTKDTYGQQLVAAATRATRRGAELTGKLLAFSRRQVLQPSAVDVSELLHTLSDMLRRTLDQHIQIDVAALPDCPPVLADPGQLESALLNIAINARDAMPDGGTLRFKAEAIRSLPDELRHELNDDAGTESRRFVAISISDTGGGMPEKVRERAFEPFFTTKEAGRGTGLGLSTVYGFVKQSKGAIVIDSTPGVGTVVTLYLPHLGDVIAPLATDAGAGQVLPAGLTVLLVEDDFELRCVVRTFLDGLGCRVTEAATGEQALLALDAETNFELLITDIALGAGIRGTRLATQARQRFPKMAVLLMSGFSQELLDADRGAQPHRELLRKPFSRDELARAIGRALAAR